MTIVLLLTLVKQKWFLLRLVSNEKSILLDQNQRPEFDCWKWVDYWQPVKDVIDFKRKVYQSALECFAPIVNR